ncbi:helix-turn-helix domain-containing protein [Treponema primitia]|uniref:helix-turn-helix domain-containing protein n=1 Tax=Treponema primitia TaxID=88058 RepID=UPI0039805DAC
MKGFKIRSVLSTNIRFYRNRHGWSQSELAEKADISTNFLSDIETCKKWPFPETLEKIAQGLKIEVYDLFKPESPSQEHPAFDVLRHYNEDVKLLINKANIDVERSLDTILAKYGPDGT